MHHSRFCSIILDSKTDDVDAAAEFWSKALGRPVEKSEGKYRKLAMTEREPIIEVQQVTHESRAHIDIESDDVEAEVRRLEKLGAKAIERIKTWCVMEAPSGARFCVIRPQRGDLTDDNSNVWP